MLERDVRYLDSRIALLIANRMALDEVIAYSHASNLFDNRDVLVTKPPIFDRLSVD